MQSSADRRLSFRLFNVADLMSNGVDVWRAGDVNPLICCDCWKNPGTYVPGSPLEFLKFTPLDRMAEAAA